MTEPPAGAPVEVAEAATLGPAPAALPHDWPQRAHSRSVLAGGLRWHVQLMGPTDAPGARQAPTAPVVLLLHGTGASSHSFAALAPLLARTHRVLVPDLPGHAHTQRPASDDGLSLPGMARALGALLAALHVRPTLVVGHSAGAAVAARLCLDGHCAPQHLVSLNGAWFPPRGVGNWWYAPAAKLLVRNPLVPRFFAWQASQPRVLQRLLDSTGSRLPAAATAPYARLVADPAHVAAVLAMMASWDLRPLLHDLPRLAPRLHLVVGQRDTTIAPREALQVQPLVPGSTLSRLPACGHLAHEEDPAGVAALLVRWVPGLATEGSASADAPD
jgi:magnesium chelatase accessory protein